MQSELTAISQAKPMLQVLRRQKSERVPVWLMRQAGRYLPEYRALRASASGFLDFCLTPDLAVEATLQPIVRFGLDAAILFSDILVVPYGLRQRVWFEERVGPLLEPIAGVGDLMRLDTAGMIATLAPVYETVRRVRSRLPAECTLIGFAGAPWTLASYMIEGRSSRDFAKAKLWAYGRPGDFQQLIDLLVDAVSAHLEAQVAAGAEVLQIFDSWAGALDHAATRRWSLEPIRAITARLKRLRPDVPVIVFPRGIGTGYRDFALEGVGDALSLDQAVDPAWAREIIQGKMVLQGNLDPQRLLLGGAGMRLAARRILNCFAGAPFIFNLGHGVLPETPPDHVAELVTTVRSGDP